MSKVHHSAGVPTPRMLRVGELIRHTISDLLSRGAVNDPVLEGHVVTIPDVRMSPDLKLATVYVMPLGGKDMNEVIAAFDRNKRFLRGEIAHSVNLKFAPDIRFRPDQSFDSGARIDALLELAASQARSHQERRGLMNAPRSKRTEINGWVVLDKPVGMTSTHAVTRLKRLFNAKKAGHAGTLDPLASGVLPVAFGEATKTVPFVQDGEKAYRFTIQWGAETDSDDADGQITAQSEARPQPEAILAALPHFIGTILQLPPAFSAIKIAGERAYDIARDGETPQLTPRPVTIHELVPVSLGRDEATFEARCGKGTYCRDRSRPRPRARLLRPRQQPCGAPASGPLARWMLCHWRRLKRPRQPMRCAASRRGSKNCRK